MKIREMGGGHKPFPFAENNYTQVVRIDWDPAGASVVHDLNKFPYPFEDNTFEVVYSSYCIEHQENKLKFS